jgi:AcrR family transcriptional regulator
MLQVTRSRVARRKEKTKKMLLEVALELFYEKGIYWTKIEDITERTDIGKGTFYQYFATKEAVLQALLQQGVDALLARIAAECQTIDPSPRTVTMTIKAQLDFFLENPQYLLLFHQVRGLLQLKSGAAKELRTVYSGYLDRLGQMIQPALDGKPVYQGAVRELALAISAFTSGLLTYHLLFSKARQLKLHREHIQAQIERSVQALLNGNDQGQDERSAAPSDSRKT